MRTLFSPLVLLAVLGGTSSHLRACEPGCPRGLDVTIHDVEPSDLPERIPVPELRTLEFVNVRLSAARLHALLASTRVRAISIEGCPVGDDVCAVLARHPGLVEVRLVGTCVTDEGLAMLSGLEHLRTVDLRGTRVSREGVTAFLESSGVTFVDVRGTSIGHDVQSALAARDDLRILLDEPTRPDARVVTNTADAADSVLVQE